MLKEKEIVPAILVWQIDFVQGLLGGLTPCWRIDFLQEISAFLRYFKALRSIWSISCSLVQLGRVYAA